MILLRGALLWMLAALPAAAECVMSVRLDEDPPYLMTLPDGQAGGVNADVVREALRRMGCRADFRVMPFSRALKELQQGGLDIVPNMFRTPDRQAFVFYSRTRDKVPNRLFVRAGDKGRWDIANLGDLPRLGVRLGVTGGGLASPEFAAVVADPAFKAILTPAHSHEGLLRMLHAGRVDAVILDEQTAQWELAHLGFSESVAGTGFVAAAAPGYFGFSRAKVSEEQVAAFDAAIGDMRKDGMMAAILSRYGLAPDAAIDILE